MRWSVALLLLAASICAAPVRLGEPGLINGLGVSGLKRSSSSFDADAQDYFTRVEAAGGTISTPTRVAVNAFVVSAKANGYWTKLTRINLFCGDQLAAALVPLKVGGGNATDTNNNFVAGDYSEATGLTAGTGNEFLDTGLLANALTANSTHLAIYNRSSLDATGGSFGAANGVTNILRVYPPFTDGTFYSDQYNGTTGRVSAAITGPFGFLVASRTAAGAHAVYRNGSSIASNATSGGSLPALAAYVFAHNLDSVATQFMSAAIGGYSIGSGLTGANVTSYNTDLEVFQDALGRGVQ